MNAAIFLSGWLILSLPIAILVSKSFKRLGSRDRFPEEVESPTATEEDAADHQP